MNKDQGENGRAKMTGGLSLSTWIYMIVIIFPVWSKEENKRTFFRLLGEGLKNSGILH